MDSNGYNDRGVRPTWQSKATGSQRDQLLQYSAHHRSESDEIESTSPEVVAQRRMVHRAMQEHKATTASAERSLALAESCMEIGSATLEEVSRQGEALDGVDRGLYIMEEEVEEAESLIKFMQKCCLFQVLCCCCTDKDVKRDRSRKKRLNERRKDSVRVREAMAMAREDKRKDIHELLDDHEGEDNVGAHRSTNNLDNTHNNTPAAIKVAAKYHHAGGSGSTVNIPYTASSEHSNAAVRSGAITVDEIRSIQEESLQQDRILSQIDKTMDKLKVMGMALRDEFVEQEPQIDQISDRTLSAQTSLTTLTRRARKI